MRKDIADLWIADLRTNPPKATGVLYDGTGYCCLGRLCLIVGKEFKRYKDSSWYTEDNNGNHVSMVLPQDVKELVKIKSKNGSFDTGTGPSEALSECNDEGKTFAEIADIIEQHWEEL